MTCDMNGFIAILQDVRDKYEWRIVFKQTVLGPLLPLIRGSVPRDGRRVCPISGAAEFITKQKWRVCEVHDAGKACGLQPEVTQEIMWACDGYEICNRTLRKQILYSLRVHDVSIP